MGKQDSMGFQGAQAVKNPPAIQEMQVQSLGQEDPHFHFSLSCIGGGNGNPLQCSLLGNSMDRKAFWARVLGVTKSLTGLSTHSLRSLPGPCPYCFLTVPPLSPNLLPSLISLHLNLPAGTQGSSRRLNETYFL